MSSLIYIHYYSVFAMDMDKISETIKLLTRSSYILVQTMIKNHLTNSIKQYGQKKQNINFELCFFIFIFACLFFLIQKSISQPFYWDTASFLIPAAKEIADTGNILAYAKDGTDYPHTFLLPFIFSLVFRLNTNHLILIHLLSFLMSFFFLVVMYYLGKKTSGKLVGAGLALLFLTNPLFLAQTGLVYFEIIGTALRYLALLFLISKKYNKFVITALLAFLIRFENGIILLIIGVVYGIINKNTRDYWYKILILLSSNIVWFIYHYLLTGWWFYSPLRFFKENHLQSFLQAVNYLLLAQGRYVLLVTLFVFSVIYFYRNKISTISLYFALVSLPILLIITKLGYFLPRYIFSIIPVYYLLVLIVISKVLQNYKFAFVTLLILMSTVQFLHRFDCSAGNFEDCVIVSDYLEIKSQAASYLRNNFADNLIMADHMESAELTNPLLGFIDQPLQITTSTSPPPEIIYITPTSSGKLYSYATTNNYYLNKFYKTRHIEPGILIYEKNK